MIDVQQGHRLYARLRALGVRIPTIVLVDPDEIQVAVSVMKQGAFDVFERPADERALLFAMDRALRDTGPKDSMPENLEAMGRVAKLSNRERQVLDALAAGQASKAIAYELGISVRTIEVHRARMLQRLGVQNAAAAIRLAVIAECGTIAPTNDRAQAHDELPGLLRPVRRSAAGGPIGCCLPTVRAARCAALCAPGRPAAR